MSLYGVIGYHVTLSEGHMIANRPNRFKVRSYMRKLEYECKRDKNPSYVILVCGAGGLVQWLNIEYYGELQH